MNAKFAVESTGNNQNKNRQFYQCRRENRPLVTIYPGRRYATVEIDMISTDRDLDQQAVSDIRNVFVEYCDFSGEVKFSTLDCRANTVLQKHAETVAARIYDIAFSAMPRLRPIGVVGKPSVADQQF